MVILRGKILLYRLAHASTEGLKERERRSVAAENVNDYCDWVKTRDE